jgi:hypothetical protein
VNEEVERKARSKRTTAGEPCHSLTTLLDELATRTTIRLHESSASSEQLTQLTPTQARARARADRRLHAHDVVMTDPGAAAREAAQKRRAGCCLRELRVSAETALLAIQ